MRVADLFTYASVASALSAVFFVLRGDPRVAAALLFASVLFDFLDGRVARWRGEQGPFGVALDSLADIVAFGAVPAIMALLLVPTLVVLLTGIVFVCAGAFRLARFQTTKHPGYFQGVPITANGMFFPFLLLWATNATAFALYFACMAVLMASRIEVRKL